MGGAHPDGWNGGESEGIAGHRGRFFCLVLVQPVIKLGPEAPRGTRNCCHEPQGSGARLVEFEDRAHRRPDKGGTAINVLYPRCAGLDVHKATIMACAQTAPRRTCTVGDPGVPHDDPGLLALSDWLTGHAVTHVAMEATGVYWKPAWHVLDEAFELVLANAAHIRNVPGRKSDVTDAAWIADLLAHGLIRGSFVPPAAVQALRNLTRTRKQPSGIWRSTPSGSRRPWRTATLSSAP